jgi:hypothetical protein
MLMPYRTVFTFCTFALLFCACQKPGDPVVPMTQEQWRRVDKYLIDELPANAEPIDARFGDSIELVGWSMEPKSVDAGEEFTLKLYWQATQKIDRPWEIFIHMDGNNSRQTVDHAAASGVLPVVHWPDDKIVVDEMTQTMSSSMDGEITVYAGLYIGEERLPVTDLGQAESEDDNRLNLGQFEARWEAPSYAVRWVNRAIDLDGRIVEREWSRAPATDRWVHPVSGDRVEAQHTWAKMLWDRENLYVAIRGRDTDIWSEHTERDSNLWEEEVFEVYLDPQSDGQNYLELQVNPNNAIFDAKFPSANNRDHREARKHNVSGLETMVYIQGSKNERDDRDVYWSLEMKIPWTSLPDFETPPTNDREFAVNFYRYDRNKDEGVKTTAWSPVGSGSFHRPERFGIATLTNGPPLPPPSAEEGEDDPEPSGSD